MSTQTMRQAINLHRDTIARWIMTSAFFALGALAVTQSLGGGLQFTMHPAAEAISTPVSAAVPSSNAAAATTASAEPSWDLANIENPRVDSWVQRFSTSLKGDISAALDRGEKVIPMISAKLADRNMPQELAYLPLIESGYQTHAKSRVSAVGLWQFMASTARNLGLSVGRHGDDRTNVAKSTDAALTYLSQLHERFGSWYLALAAYNAGPGTVSKTMGKVLGRTTGSDADFYAIAKHLPAETREYVPKLIAAARIAKDTSSTD
ncbi:MAG TPA: lytic transglycosylase domain-containing protein [Gemmatimonadaceae bacterium]|nr:lytic transglycosylase domain-containing protein [Gemmatimonadaceae bacterium]